MHFPFSFFVSLYLSPVSLLVLLYSSACFLCVLSTCLAYFESLSFTPVCSFASPFLLFLFPFSVSSPKPSCEFLLSLTFLSPLRPFAVNPVLCKKKKKKKRYGGNSALFKLKANVSLSLENRRGALRSQGDHVLYRVLTGARLGSVVGLLSSLQSCIHL